ncbi:hypothetical protein LJR069_001836 [Variovorax paradoxus]
MVFEIGGRFLYPFGDEPDFIARAPGLIFGDHSWINPYFWLDGILATLNFSSSCNIQAAPLSIWAEIDSLSCSESIGQIASRIFIAVVICAPLIFTICFAWGRSRKILGVRILNYEGQRGEALALSLLVPGVTYSLGVLAEEQLVLMLSLLIIMVDRRWVIAALLVAAILAVDFGNGVVVLTVLIFLNGYRHISKFVGIRIILLLALGQAAIALVAGIAFIGFLSNFSFLADKADAIYSAVSGSELVDKYPVYLRPVITFMTGVFMTPSFVKVLPAFLVMGASLTVVGWRLAKVYSVCEFEKIDGKYLNDGSRERVVDCCAIVATVLLFIFLIPTYSNAKYYLFVIPFLMRGALLVMQKKKIMKILISSQLIVLGGLLLYRL